MPRKLTPQQKFERKVNRLIKESDNLSLTAIKRTRKLVQETHDRIVLDLSKIPVGPDKTWEAYRLGELKRATKTQLDIFDRQFKVKIAEDQAAGWQMGRRLVDEPLKVIGITAPITEFSTTTLSILQDYSADLVSGISRNALKKVNGALAQGVLGQKTPFEVMQDLSSNVFGVRKGISAEAERIVRTEMSRIQNAGTQARQEQAVKAGVKLLKQWTGCRSRPTHLAAEGQVREVHEYYDIGSVKLMYPGDPGAPPGETINCGGYSRPFMDDWDQLFTEAWLMATYNWMLIALRG